MSIATLQCAAGGKPVVKVDGVELGPIIKLKYKMKGEILPKAALETYIGSADVVDDFATLVGPDEQGVAQAVTLALHIRTGSFAPDSECGGRHIVDLEHGHVFTTKQIVDATILIDRKRPSLITTVYLKEFPPQYLGMLIEE